MRGWKEKRISTLLRMAELCSSDQEERKNRYLNEADKLMFGDVDDVMEQRFVIEDGKYKHLENFYKKYRDRLNWETGRNNYKLYIAYCKSVGETPLKFRSFCKAMTDRFPFKSVVTHDGCGYERVCVRKWVITEEWQKKSVTKTW